MENKPNKYELLENIYYVVLIGGKWIAIKESDYIVEIKFEHGDYGEIIYTLFNEEALVKESDVFPSFIIAEFVCEQRNKERVRRKNVTG